MAAISDKITKTMKEQNPNPTTVSTQRAAGATELQAQNLDGWPDETAVHFMTYKVDTQGQVVAGSKVDWKGVVNRNSNKIINLERQAGAADQGNSVNDIVQAGPTASWANDYAEALLKLHDTDGNLKSGAVPFTALDLGTEYQTQAALVDFNDAKFLKPSKWVFTSKDNVTRSTNRPCDDAGWLTVQLLDATKIPGSHQGGFILQQYIDTDGRVYSRTVNSKNSSEAVYGKWQAMEGTGGPSQKDHKPERVNIGHGIFLNIARTGNMVSATIQQTVTMPGGQFVPSEKIPQKYRPLDDLVCLKVTAVNNSRYAGDAMYRFKKDGVIIGNSIGGYNEWYGSAVWETDQPWT